MKKTTNKIGLVTGANKGIGYEVARQLAVSGCTILLGARNLALGEEAAAKLAAENLDVHYIPVDLDDTAAIAAAARDNVPRPRRRPPKAQQECVSLRPP